MNKLSVYYQMISLFSRKNKWNIFENRDFLTEYIIHIYNNSKVHKLKSDITFSTINS